MRVTKRIYLFSCLLIYNALLYTERMMFVFVSRAPPQTHYFVANNTFSAVKPPLMLGAFACCERISQVLAVRLTCDLSELYTRVPVKHACSSRERKYDNL